MPLMIYPVGAGEPPPPAVITARYFFAVPGLLSSFDNEDIVGITGQDIPISTVEATLEVAEDDDVAFDVVLVNRTTGVVTTTLKTCTIPTGQLLLNDSFAPAIPDATLKVKILVQNVGTTGKSLGVLVK